MGDFAGDRFPANRFRTGGLCELAVGFPIWHLGRNLLARHLAPGLSYGLLVEALGFFLLLQARRPDFLAVGGGGSVLGLEERLEEVYRDGQDDGGVLVYCDLSHSLKEPKLQSSRALQTVRCLPEAL